MLSRRSLVLAPMCAYIFSKYARANQPQIEGCCLIGVYPDDLGLEYGFVGSGRDVERMVFTSRDAETDHRLGQALLRLADVFEVNPGCGFFDDEKSPNALAVPKNLVPGTEGTVLFGQ